MGSKHNFRLEELHVVHVDLEAELLQVVVEHLQGKTVRILAQTLPYYGGLEYLEQNLDLLSLSTLSLNLW